MRKYFFLGVGVGFIFAGIVMTIYLEIDKKRIKEIKATSVEMYTEEKLTGQAVFLPSEPEVKVSEGAAVPKEAPVEPEKPKPKKEEKSEISEIKVAEEKKTAQQIVKPKAEIKKEEMPQKKSEKPPVETKKTEKIKQGETTAPLPPVADEKAKNETVKEEKKINVKEEGQEYYIQLIASPVYADCERVIKKVKIVELTAPKKGNKFVVVSSGNFTQKEGKKLLEEIEAKYKIKGMLIKKK